MYVDNRPATLHCESDGHHHLITGTLEIDVHGIFTAQEDLGLQLYSNENAIRQEVFRIIGDSLISSMICEIIDRKQLQLTFVLDHPPEAQVIHVQNESILQGLQDRNEVTAIENTMNVRILLGDSQERHPLEALYAARHSVAAKIAISIVRNLKKVLLESDEGDSEYTFTLNDDGTVESFSSEPLESRAELN